MSAAATPRPVKMAFISLVFVLLCIIGGMFAIDFTLAEMEQTELAASASALYRQGVSLLTQGKAAEAVDILRSAHMTDRRNRQYELKLAEALIAAGKTDQASELLTDLLESDPNGGDANLLMARLLLKQGKTADAISYYHRAIYGNWGDHPEARRLATRFELVKLLESHGNEKQLLGELLPLDSEAPDDPATRLRIAQLYTQAGSPARSAAVYRALLDRDRDNIKALQGLGAAELALGDYTAALSAFVNAFHRNPSDAGLRKQIELASAMTALDPTLRRLRSSEKYRRATRILELARDSMQECAVQRGAASSDDLGLADALLSGQNPPHITNELAEERLSLAETLWKSRVQSCGIPVSARDLPLRLIMDKITQ